MASDQQRAYHRASSVVFLKTNEPFGGLSNMAGGFPLHLQGTRIHTSEALYQACRFPHLPEIQRLIIAQASPMTAKMKSKLHRKDSRPDWDRVRVKVMRWCLRVKLAQNWAQFSELLVRTGDRPIVEESHRDDFWGAKTEDGQTLIGMNVLGRLLMELREAIKSPGSGVGQTVAPPQIPRFLLLGRNIDTVRGPFAGRESVTNAATRVRGRPLAQEAGGQVSLPYAPSVRASRASAYLTSPTTVTVRLVDLKPHTRMKDSGVAWLGQVPEHWQVSPAVTVYRPRQVKNTGLIEKTVLSLSYGRIVVKPAEKLRGLVPDSFETYQIVDQGNIIVRTTDLQNDQTSLRVGLARHRGTITAAYMCLETTSLMSSDFGYQYLNAYDLLKIIYGFGSGLRQKLDFSDIKGMPVLVPPREEQAAIVRFLDHTDRQIQRYIRAKQKLIKLLEEQKQAIIHQAVTRGLDPNVRLKPSGVEWLGDVPEHWDLVILGRALIAIGQGWSPVAAEGQISPDQWAVLTLSSVRRGRFNPNAIKPIPDSARIPGGIEVNDGDLLLTRSNTRELVGDACIVAGARPKTVLCDLIYRLIPDSARYESTYLMHQLLSRVGRQQIEQDARGSSGTMPKISQRHVRAWRVLCPPLDEQRSISAVIVRESDRANAAVDRARREISLLREYRARLIADVVTGKLDVREAAARLPEEVGERDPMDEPRTESAAKGMGHENIDEVPEEVKE